MSPTPLELVARPADMRHHEGYVDVCIIGCGASGSVLAKELAEAGRSVVVLEAGPWLSTDDDLRQDEVEMLGRFDWDDRRWLSGDEELELGHRRDGRGVGGGTLHFGAVALRLWQEDFERRRRDGVGADWPFPYADIVPFYDEVETELALSGPRSMPWGGPHPRAYPQPPHALSARDLIVARGMQELGIGWSENALAILTGRHDGRSPCMNYGYCQWGCKSRAKSSMHVTYVPKAVIAGAEIRDRSRVVHLEVDDLSGRISGVVYVRDGVTHRQRADVVILAGFCIENPRLLLHSASPAFPDGLANRSGTVGRYLLAHIADSCFGRFEQPVHQWSTSPGTLLSQHHYGTRSASSYVGGWSWMTSCLFPGEFGITLARSGEGWWGQRLSDALAAYPHWLVLGSEGECLAYAGNRVELSDDVDEFGVPRPRVHFDFGDNEHSMRADIHRIAHDILTAAGASEIVISEGNDHLMGGCRMGTSPTESVVDANCRTWDHPNLFICDASVFPSSGGAQPSQTVMALAVRLARHLDDPAMDLHPSRSRLV
jgi:choline dehydrogenase-like flavoprotein